MTSYSNIPFVNLPIAIGRLGSSDITVIDQGGTTKQATVRQMLSASIDANFPSALEYVIDGGGSALTTGTKGYLEVPFDCTIVQVTLLPNIIGSIVVDIWKCTYAQFDAGVTHPVVADTITGSQVPTITLSDKYQSSTLTGWTIDVSAGDILAYNINSVATIGRILVSLKTLRLLS